MEMNISMCCNAPAIVEGSSEGTNYDVCTDCNQPCDVLMIDIDKKTFNCPECGNTINHFNCNCKESEIV